MRIPGKMCRRWLQPIRLVVWVALVVAWIVPHRAQAAPPMLGATAVGLVGQGQYGTIKGRLVWGGDQLPPVKVFAEKGTAAKDPEVYARNQPILSRELAVDPATKGLPYEIGRAHV